MNRVGLEPTPWILLVLMLFQVDQGCLHFRDQENVLRETLTWRHNQLGHLSSEHFVQIVGKRFVISLHKGNKIPCWALPQAEIKREG